MCSFTWFLVGCCAFSLLLDWSGVSVGMGPIGVGWRNITEKTQAISDIRLTHTRVSRFTILKTRYCVYQSKVSQYRIYDKCLRFKKKNKKSACNDISCKISWKNWIMISELNRIVTDPVKWPSESTLPKCDEFKFMHYVKVLLRAVPEFCRPSRTRSRRRIRSCRRGLWRVCVSSHNPVSQRSPISWRSAGTWPSLLHDTVSLSSLLIN